MVDIKRTTVRLGERDYEIQEAGFRRAKPWKQRLLAEIKPLFERLGGAGEIQFEKPADLFQLLPLAEDLFVGGVDTVCDLLIAYSPVLEADREYIETDASDRQILAAFQEVVILADPFGVVMQLNRRLGRTTTGM